MDLTTNVTRGFAVAAFLLLPLHVRAGEPPAVVFGRQGEPTADIVLPDKPRETETYAAEELRYHLGRILGQAPKVVSEKDFTSSDRPFHVFIGATAAAKRAGLLDVPPELEEFRLKTDGNRLFLFGGDREGVALGNVWSASCHGTLFAVYEFLEKQAGVKWLWPGKSGEVIPRNPDFACGSQDAKGRPVLSRRTYYYVWPDQKNLIGFAKVENRDRYFADRRTFMLRQRSGCRYRLRSGHAFEKMWQRFGATHPEWFQLRPDGKRGPLEGDTYGGGGGGCTMCVSNQEVWKQVVADWLAEREKGDLRSCVPPYDPHVVNCCENDSPGMCTCPNCRAWDAPDPGFAVIDYWNGSGKDPLIMRNRYGRLAYVQWGEEGEGPDGQKIIPPSVADRYAKFYNAVLAEALKRDPAARVVGYAYANYTAAPKETKLDPRVIIEHVPRLYYPYSEEESAVFREQWLGWHRAGAKDMILRPNYTHHGGSFPLDCGRRAVADFAFAATNGMFGCGFDSLLGTWSNQAMEHYAMFRAMREPLCSYERSLDEMCSAFGNAAAAIRKYFAYVEAFTYSKTHEDFKRICKANITRDGVTPGGGFSRFTYVVGDFYPDSFFAEGRRLLTEARKAAKRDEETVARIAFLAKGLKDARLTRATRSAHKAWSADKGNAAKKAAFEAVFREMCAYRASVEDEDVCDWEQTARIEKGQLGWPHETVPLVKK